MISEIDQEKINNGNIIVIKRVAKELEKNNEMQEAKDMYYLGATYADSECFYKYIELANMKLRFDDLPQKAIDKANKLYLKAMVKVSEIDGNTLPNQLEKILRGLEKPITLGHVEAFNTLAYYQFRYNKKSVSIPILEKAAVSGALNSAYILFQHYSAHNDNYDKDKAVFFGLYVAFLKYNPFMSDKQKKEFDDYQGKINEFMGDTYLDEYREKVTSQEEQKAFAWYEKSYDNLEKNCNCMGVAKCYFNGIGTKKDVLKGIEVLEFINTAESLAELGKYYFYGQVIKQDLKAAKDYFKQSLAIYELDEVKQLMEELNGQAASNKEALEKEKERIKQEKEATKQLREQERLEKERLKLEKQREKEEKEKLKLEKQRLREEKARLKALQDDSK